MDLINLNYTLLINFLLFFIGITGLVINRKNLLISIMTIELLILSINLNFVVFSLYLDDMYGQVFILFILSISAVESVIGLALITAYFRLKNSIEFEKIIKR